MADVLSPMLQAERQAIRVLSRAACRFSGRHCDCGGDRPCQEGQRLREAAALVSALRSEGLLATERETPR